MLRFYCCYFCLFSIIVCIAHKTPTCYETHSQRIITKTKHTHAYTNVKKYYNNFKKYTNDITINSLSQ